MIKNEQDTKTLVDPELVTQPHPYFEDAHIFMDSLQRAKEHNMEFEFVAAFLQFYKGDDVRSTAAHALYEWDLI